MNERGSGLFGRRLARLVLFDLLLDGFGRVLLVDHFTVRDYLESVSVEFWFPIAVIVDVSIEPLALADLGRISIKGGGIPV